MFVFGRVLNLPNTNMFVMKTYLALTEVITKKSPVLVRFD